jgi:hypothetical protein
MRACHFAQCCLSEHVLTLGLRRVAEFVVDYGSLGVIPSAKAGGDFIPAQIERCRF